MGIEENVSSSSSRRHETDPNDVTRYFTIVAAGCLGLNVASDVAALWPGKL